MSTSRCACENLGPPQWKAAQKQLSTGGALSCTQRSTARLKPTCTYALAWLGLGFAWS